MTVMDVEIAEGIVARWRTMAEADNPAGPLYTSGAFAESDIIEAETSYGTTCSACTASPTAHCC
jgi:Family of unknown function (DUF6229)